MATTFTLTEMIEKVRQRADMVNSGFVTDAEVTGYINASYAELYDLLVQKYGDDYFVASPQAITTDGTNYLYSLASDFYKLLGVDLSISGSADGYVNIPKFEFADRNKFSTPNNQSFYGVNNLRYRLNGNKLWFTPLPSAGQSIRVWYVPRITYLSAGADTLDGISGWEEYVVIDSAMKCLLKEESDVSALMMQKQSMVLRIESAAENRDAGSPPKVVDSQGDCLFFDGEF